MQLSNLSTSSTSLPQRQKTVSAYEARRKFGQLIEEAYYNNDAFVVERSGRPMVAIVSVNNYQKWQRIAKEQVFQMVDEVWKRNKDTPLQALEDDVAKAVATLRLEQQKKKSV